MKTPKEPKLRVTELNLSKSAQRLLGQRLVSPEVQYIQRVMAASATQQEIDANVMAVRRLPWTTIVVPD